MQCVQNTGVENENGKRNNLSKVTAIFFGRVKILIKLLSLQTQFSFSSLFFLLYEVKSQINLIFLYNWLVDNTLGYPQVVVFPGQFGFALVFPE